MWKKTLVAGAIVFVTLGTYAFASWAISEFRAWRKRVKRMEELELESYEDSMRHQSA